MRDKLWQAFIDEVAASDQPELRINLAILRLAQAARGEPRVKARHALQKTLIDNAGCFRAAASRTDFSYVWALAFPPLRVSDDKYETAVLFRRNPQIEINNGSYEGPFDVLYDRYALIGRNRGSFTPARHEDVRTDAENACRFFLAITPEGRLREPDVKALILPHVGFLTEDEARAVYQLAAGYRPETSPPLVDAVALQQELGKRFPALLDEAHLSEVARRQADGQPPSNALIVSREISLPPCEGTDKPRFCARRWANNRFWACWGDALIELDPATKACNLLPLPERITRRMFDPVSGLEVAESTLLCWASKHETSTEFGLRPLTGGEWRFVSFPFEVRAATQLDSKIYMITVVPRLSLHQATGLVRMDPETLECETLRSPGTPRVKVARGSKEIPFEALPFEFQLQVQDGLLLESSGGRIRHGWNPKTNRVQPVKAKLRGYTEVDTSPYLTASQPFGFTLSPVNGLIIVCEKERFKLRVVRAGSASAESVPLVFKNLPNLKKVDARTKAARFVNPISYATDAVLTPTAVYIPFFRDRGFYEIPYTDIQQWLAAHPAPVPATKGN